MANGIYTNSELLDSIFVDINSAIKEVISGQYINACTIVTSMAQKLANLRNTLNNDLKNRDEIIEQLKQELRDAGRGVEDMPPKDFVRVIAGKENKEGET